MSWGGATKSHCIVGGVALLSRRMSGVPMNKFALILLLTVLSSSIYAENREGWNREELTTDCHQNNAQACLRIGLLWAEGKNGPKNLPKAREFYEAACDMEMWDGCVLLENLLAIEEDQKGLEKIKKISADRCEIGQSKACYLLAMMWHDGTGGPKDSVSSREYFSRACELEHARSCIFVGNMWAEGKGGAQDHTVAREFFSRSCDLYDGVGCLALAESFSGDTGGPKDMEKARKYYDLACTSNIALACFKLGLMWDDGEGGPANIDKSRDYIKKACYLDYTIACYPPAVIIELPIVLSVAVVLIAVFLFKKFRRKKNRESKSGPYST